MFRIQIVAAITTGKAADVFALHTDVAAAADEAVVFTVADEGLVLTVDGGDLPAVLAVIVPSDALGQITLFASEVASLPAAA